MKCLIMCEGPNELGIMRILLRYDKLIFGEDDLRRLNQVFPQSNLPRNISVVAGRNFGGVNRGDGFPK